MGFSVPPPRACARGSPASRRAAFAAAHEFAHPFLAEPLGPVADQLPAQEHLLHSPGDPMPLEERVVHPTVPLGAADRPRLLGVEQDKVRIRADGDRAFPGEQPEELGRRRRGQLDEAVQRQPMLPHGAVEDHLAVTTPLIRTVRSGWTKPPLSSPCLTTSSTATGNVSEVTRILNITSSSA